MHGGYYYLDVTVVQDKLFWGLFCKIGATPGGQRQDCTRLYKRVKLSSFTSHARWVRAPYHKKQGKKYVASKQTIKTIRFSCFVLKKRSPRFATSA